MNVRKIEIEGFTSHQSTTVDLPERGLVLITGPNGAGKSSFPEAVAVAGWGKTLRGTDPWREGQAGSVTVTTDLGVMSRKITAKGTKSADFVAEPGAPVRRFDTATKAKGAAQQVIGDLDMWRRTHVFSSQDAAHFTMSTDGERKELLEELLHLSCFDEAATRCKADLKKADGALALARSKLAAAQQVQSSAAAAIEALANSPGEPPPAVVARWDEKELPPYEQERARLDEQLREAQQRSNEAVSRMRPPDLTRAFNLAEGEQAAAEKHLRAVTGGTCSACGQAIDLAHRQDAERRLAAAQAARSAAEAALRMAERTAQVDFDACARRLAELEAQRRSCAESGREILGRQAAWTAYVSALSTWKAREMQRRGQKDQMETRWQVADEAVYDAQVDVDAILSTHAELVVCSDVLGMRGVRAHVLGQALGGIEAVANIYLSKIAQRNLQLKLKSYTESSTGNVQDKISLEVEGAGGGHGYRASSGGERRRIDAALLLALAEVSSAASGKEPGTLWFDEVFDALDTDGVDAVVETLTELAVERAIVVITHVDELAKRIPAVKRIRVVNGAVAA